MKTHVAKSRALSRFRSTAALLMEMAHACQAALGSRRQSPKLMKLKHVATGCTDCCGTGEGGQSFGVSGATEPGAENWGSGTGGRGAEDGECGAGIGHW